LCFINIINTIIVTPITNHKLIGHLLVCGIEFKFKNISSDKILKIILEIKIVEAPIIEPNETIFVIKYTTKKAIAPIKKMSGTYPNATPAPVATAFPPLKFQKIGNICPITAETPYKIGDNKHHS
jgi:hypothetical protein